MILGTESRVRFKKDDEMSVTSRKIGRVSPIHGRECLLKRIKEK